MSWEIKQGDCLEVLKTLESSSLDSVVVDPPYGIGFMGHEWDQPGESHAPVGPDEEAEVQGGRRRRSQPTAATGAGHARDRETFGGPLGQDHTTTRERGGAMHAGRYDLSSTANRRFQAWCEAWATECFRVLKPGGHLLSFGGTRTYHRLAAGIEDAGFEIRDCLVWLFGSGFPKSKNLDGDWEGWGTALKPGHEPIVMARKPFALTVAGNVAEHGTGAINIDGCRVGTGEGGDREGEASAERRYTEAGGTNFAPMPGPRGGDAAGRWPANVIMDPEAGAMLDEQIGDIKGGPGGVRERPASTDLGVMNDDGWEPKAILQPSYNNSGGPSRFFYCAKSSRAEREAGLEGMEARSGGALSRGLRNTVARCPEHDSPLPSGSNTYACGCDQVYDNGEEDRREDERPRANNHPTVKPIDLMRWCVRLVTPPGGIVLDCFTGSGTTGIAAALEGFDFLGIERDEDYIKIAEARISWWAERSGDTAEILQRAGLLEKAQAIHEEIGQMGMDFDA